MVGHLKLLSDRKTLKERLRTPTLSLPSYYTKPDIYLVFRREPLWQVSMNVKVNNGVRCTYEREENAIRLVLKEPAGGQLVSSSKDQQLEVVVYALKVRSLPVR